MNTCHCIVVLMYYVILTDIYQYISVLADKINLQLNKMAKGYNLEIIFNTFS